MRRCRLLKKRREVPEAGPYISFPDYKLWNNKVHQRISKKYMGYHEEKRIDHGHRETLKIREQR